MLMLAHPDFKGFSLCQTLQWCKRKQILCSQLKSATSQFSFALTYTGMISTSDLCSEATVERWQLVEFCSWFCLQRAVCDVWALLDVPIHWKWGCSWFKSLWLHCRETQKTGLFLPTTFLLLEASAGLMNCYTSGELSRYPKRDQARLYPVSKIS